MILNLVFRNYSYLLHTIPLFVYTFYIIFRDADNPLIDKFLKTGLNLLGICTFYLIFCCIEGIPFKEIIPFTWSYSGPITWGIFFFLYFHILYRKEENTVKSFTLAMLAAVGCGWLYEVSFFHPVSMFLGKGSFFYINIQIMCFILLFVEMKIKSLKPKPISYIILILSFILGWSSFPYPNSQIICLVLLLYELRKMSFKTNRIILIMFIVFMIFSTSLFLNKDFLWRLCRNSLIFLNVKLTPLYAQNVKWIYRIPASLFLLSLLSGINKKKVILK